MKNRSVAFVLLATAVLMAGALTSAAATRTVLVEAFTNWSCNPCASWNPTERAVLDALGRDTVICIKYHVNWPGPNDGFYLWNVTENTNRWNAYGVNSVPDGRIDGTTTVLNSATSFRNQIRNRRAIPAPCTMTLSAMAAGSDSVHVTGTITASDSAINGAKLYLALITDIVHYNSAPGSNGETLFPDPFRDLAPSTSGLPVTLALGGTFEINMMMHKDAAWNADSLSVVAFLQNSTTKWVHQAAWAHVFNPWGMSLTGDNPLQSIAVATEEAIYTLNLKNTGTNNDTYTVSLGDMPYGWTQSIEASGIPGDPVSINVPLNSGQDTWLTLHVNPNNLPGNAELAIMVQSTGNDTNMTMRSYAMSAGLSILLMDDDGGPSPGPGNFDDYYSSSLSRVSDRRPWGRWDSQISALDQEQLNRVPMVIWFTGSRGANQSLHANDIVLIESYLNHGGMLFLSGQGIAFDLRSNPFLGTALHAQFVSPPYQSNQPPLAGIAANPISDGLSFSLGGDGAHNQVRPNKIRPTDAAATPLLTWQGVGADTCAALAIETATTKAIYLAFGFEAIDTEAARDSLMSRALYWMLGTAAVDPRGPSQPTSYLLGQNYPNPFNPETVIPYALPARAMVSLRIFDVLGREIAVLAQGPQEAGSYAVRWNAASAPSGLYFCRMEAASGAGQYRATRKLLLVK